MNFFVYVCTSFREGCFDFSFVVGWNFVIETEFFTIKILALGDLAYFQISCLKSLHHFLLSLPYLVSVDHCLHHFSSFFTFVDFRFSFFLNMYDKVV